MTSEQTNHWKMHIWKEWGFTAPTPPQNKPLVMKVPLHTLHQPKYRWEQNYYHLYEISNFPYCFCNRAILIIPKQGYTKWSQHFQVSTTGVRSIIKKLKESHRVQNEPGRGRKPKISKTLERKFANNCQNTIEWLSQVGNCSLQEDYHSNHVQEWIGRLQSKKNFCRRDRWKYVTNNLEK